eukprot:399546-Rhodomonas_salina.2
MMSSREAFKPLFGVFHPYPDTNPSQFLLRMGTFNTNTGNRDIAPPFRNAQLSEACLEAEPTRNCDAILSQ